MKGAVARWARLATATTAMACTSTPAVPASGETSTTSAASSSGQAMATAEDPPPGTTAIGPDSGAEADETGTADDSTGAPPEDLDVPLAYLRGEPYARLVLEIDAAGGLEPYASTTSSIALVLDELVDKPGGIDVVLDDVLIPVGSEHAWTPDERVALGDERFDLELPPDAIAIHVMLVDGHAVEDDAGGTVTLGHAWANRHVMLYKERIAAGCEAALVGDLTQVLCERTEQLLLQHELGHVLGLVDFGVPMQTDHRDPDPAHGPHDVDPQCLMHWRFETLDLLDAVLDDLVMGAPPIELDRACLQDLAAAQQ